MRCKICGRTTTAKGYIIEEKKYFRGEGSVCTGCFEAWRRFDYDYLDMKAIQKMQEILK